MVETHDDLEQDEKGNTIRSNTRRQVALVVIAAMIAAVAIPALLSIPALRGDGPTDERPNVPLDRLLLPRPAAGLPGDPSWSLYGTSQMEGEPRDNLARRWTDGSDGNGDQTGAQLTQTVQRYPSAAEADRAYISGNPITIAADSVGTSARAGALPEGLHADTAQVGCIGGDPPECHVWVYWARYGQYNVSLNSTNVDTLVAHDTFAAHIVDADRIIASHLG